MPIYYSMQNQKYNCEIQVYFNDILSIVCYKGAHCLVFHFHRALELTKKQQEDSKIS